MTDENRIEPGARGADLKEMHRALAKPRAPQAGEGGEP